MEIGSAYALQVCLLQIPAMVAFSAWYSPEKMGNVAETFTYVSSWRICLKFRRTECLFLQSNLPSMGCYRHHSVCILIDLHLYRSQE